jgi:hypothetical protein
MLRQVDNKHLIVASCSYFLSLHTLFDGVGLPAAQEQFVTFVNATSDDALVKISQSPDLST